MPQDTPCIVHATAVAVDGAGLLIRGASGAGKSALALELIARGARLVADDRVILTLQDGVLWLSAPKPISGMIEARGIGLLGADAVPAAELAAVLDLDRHETTRMPQRRKTMLHGQSFPLLHNSAHPYFAAAIMQYLRGGQRTDPQMQDQPTGTQRVVLVTGPSGAGRSTAINALEDMGYEAIDNIPLHMIPRLLETGPLARPMALGTDIRARDFSVQALIDLHRQLGQSAHLSVQMLYLDCARDVLARRFSETRRRHPMAPDAAYTQGIDSELALLTDARNAADILIDTSELSPHDLRAQLENWFADSEGQRMAVSLHSFSYKRGLPQGVDMVFDCRFLDNPHWVPELRGMTGLDPEVVAHVQGDARFAPFIDKLTDLALFVLPACKDEGKAHVSFGIGCTGGQHRSVAVTEQVARALAEHGWQVSIRHRELERSGLAARPGARSDGAVRGRGQS